MSRNSRSDARLEIWLKFNDRQGEEKLAQFHADAIRLVTTLAQANGYTIYADDFVVKDHKVLPS